MASAGTKTNASAKAKSAAKTSAAKTSAAKTSAAKTSAAKTSAAKTSAAKTSAAKTSAAKTSAAKTSAAKTSAAKTAAKTSAAETFATKTSTTNTPARAPTTRKPTAPTATKSPTTKPPTTKPAAKPAAAKPPAAKPPAAKPPAAEPPAAKPPAAKPPAAKPPAAKPPSTAGIDPLLAQFWANPEDRELLRVWADSLSERGDVRGEYIQLSLLENRTPEQEQRRRALDSKHHGKLAGPAREFLRELDLGPNGLVHAARCEADKLVAGLHAIEWINPRLALKVTSLKDKTVLDNLAKLSLERIYHVSFQWNVIGSQGGSPMTDAQLIKLAPAFRRVRHLSLDCGGYADNCFTPAGLRVLGETVEQLEFLSISYYNSAVAPYGDTMRRALPPIADYAHVIATAPGFKTLKAVFLRAGRTGSVSPDAFASLPSLVYAETTEPKSEGGWTSTYGSPGLADEIDAAKRGQRSA